MEDDPSTSSDVESKSGAGSPVDQERRVDPARPLGDPLLACRGVEARYGSLQVLFGVDADVHRGEILALLGTNGAGKSTLLKSITNLLPPSEGTVTFDGVSLDGVSAERMIEMGIAMMPGGHGTFPTLTVSENLRLAAWPIRADPDAVDCARDRALDLFPILERHMSNRAGDLSGGEQQMLSLAMALVVDPQLLCIDELSLGLAPTIVGDLVDVVHEINNRGTTVVVVEQSVNVALLLAERALFMEKGTVRFEGSTAELLDRPDVLRAVFLGNDSAVADDPTAAAEDPNGWIDQTSEPALEIVGVTKRFGGFTVLDDVSLCVKPNSIVGLIGHNGAGKTTLLDVLSGFLVPEAGRIRLGGTDVADLSPQRRALAGLGRSFQDARLYPGLTVAETLAVALDRHLANRDPLAAALRLPAAFDTDDAVAERVDELIERVGLRRYRNYLTGELSTGARRIVELGCVLAQQPAVVLLDEPSAGVAQRETEALGPLLREVQQELGCAMVIVEHDMAMMSSLCDELVALETGAVIASGPPAEVLSHPQVVSSYLGSDDTVVQRSGTRQTTPATHLGPNGTTRPRRRTPLRVR